MQKSITSAESCRSFECAAGRPKLSKPPLAERTHKKRISKISEKSLFYSFVFKIKIIKAFLISSQRIS